MANENKTNVKTDLQTPTTGTIQQQQSSASPQSDQSDPVLGSRDEIVLAYDKKKKTVKALAAMTDPEGKRLQEDYDPINKDKFLHISDKGMWKNLYENFSKQFKDPTRFNLYRIPYERATQVKKAFSEIEVNTRAAKFLDNYKLDEYGRTQREAKQYTFAEDEWPMSTIQKWGNNIMDFWRKRKAIGPMSHGELSPLTAFHFKDNGVECRGEAKFRLRRRPDGQLALIVLGPRVRPRYLQTVNGKDFTPNEQGILEDQLNLGYLADMVDKDGKPYKAFVTYDDELKEVFANHADKVVIQKSAYGHTFTPTELIVLQTAGAIEVNDLKGPNDSKFSAKLQYDARAGRVKRVFNRQERQARREYLRERDNEYSVLVVPIYDVEYTSEESPKAQHDNGPVQPSQTPAAPAPTQVPDVQTAPEKSAAKQDASAIEQRPTVKIRDQKPSKTAVKIK